MAAREIKTTIALDGEAAFKRDINDAKTSLRNLGTQLTLAAAEFKKDGDAMKLMQSRAKTLKDEISAQKNIVKALEGAVRDANAKYGEGSKEASKWEAELNRAKATMANLETELNNNNRGLDRNGKSFDSAKEKAGEFSTAVNDISKGVSFQAITSGIDRISTGFDSAIRKASQLATKMWDMMRDAASWADDEITLAKVYGISTDELQRMQYAEDFVDTSVDAIIRSRQKLVKAMGSSSDDTKDAFKTLRVPLVDQTGKMRKVEEVFWDVGGALGMMTDEVERDNIAMKLFGRGWMELRPLFETKREGYEDILAQATIVPEDNLKNLGSFKDQLDEMTQQLDVFKKTVLGELAPSFEVIAKGISDLMSQFNQYLQTDEGKALMDEFNEALTVLFSGLKDVDFQSAVDTVKGGLKSIQDAFTWISDHSGDVQNALLIIGGAFAAMKIGSFALGVGQAVYGFQNLLNLRGRTPGGGGSPTTTPTTTPAGDPAVVSGAGSALGRSLYIKSQDLSRFLVSGTNGFNLGNASALLDWGIHNTPAGRQLSNAVTGLFGGKQQFANEDLIETYWTNGIAKNAGDWWKNTQSLYGQVAKFWSGVGNSVWSGITGFFGNQKPEESSGHTYEINKVVGEPIDSGVSPTLYYTIPSGSAGGSAGGNRDLSELKKLPGETGNAVRRSVSGMKVEMDGRTVGRMIAPFVSEFIAQDIN